MKRHKQMKCLLETSHLWYCQEDMCIIWYNNIMFRMSIGYLHVVIEKICINVSDINIKLKNNEHHINR